MEDNEGLLLSVQAFKDLHGWLAEGSSASAVSATPDGHVVGVYFEGVVTNLM